MSSGWRNEPIRHGLAAQGIETSFGKSKVREFQGTQSRVPPRELYPNDGVDYSVMDIKTLNEEKVKKIVKLFWWCSTHNDWKWFDFNKFFSRVKPVMRNWVERNFENYSGRLNDDMSNWKEVLEMSEERSGGGLPAHHPRIYPLIEDVVYLYQTIESCQVNGCTLEEKIRLTDELIHAEHVTGTIVGLTEDMDKIRDNFEEEYT